MGKRMRENNSNPPTELSPRILFEDTHLVVLSKPAGLLSQGEKSGEPNLVDWCRTHFGRNYVGLVHRLDRFTSGLMVVAKRSKAAERLSESLTAGELVRVYVAILEGSLPAAAEWRHYLKKDEKTNTSKVVRESVAGGKEARLKVTPLKANPKKGLTLAEFRLDTGRSHQIRVQASAMGFPLLGDEKYGAKLNLGITRPALHSLRMEFPHPMTKELLTFTDNLPDELAGFFLG